MDNQNTEELDVNGTITGGNTGGKLLDSVEEPEFRNVGFREIKAPRGEGGQTWVIMHGWNSSPGAENIAELIKETEERANPEDRVLALDWSEASNNTGGILRAGGNGIAATWISATAEYAVETLAEEYGLNSAAASQDLNLVGHSLGSLVSSEIGQIYKTGANRAGESVVEGNGQGVGTITALDPAAETNLKPDFLFGGGSGYDVDGSVSDRQAPAFFDDSAVFSRSFIGKKSIAGNPLFADSADEAYELDFGNSVDFGGEHERVVRVFSNMLGSGNRISDLFGYDSYQSIDTLPVEEFGESKVTRRLRSRTYEGFIKVDDYNNLISMNSKSSTDSEGKIIIGGNQADEINGGVGNDKLFGQWYEDTLSGKSGDDVLVGAIGDDSLIGDGASNTGNDILYGGRGRDVLTGDGGADLFVYQAGDGDGDRARADVITDFELGVDNLGLIDITPEELTFTGDTADSVVMLGEENLAVLEGISLDEVTDASQNRILYSTLDAETFDIM